MPAEGLHALLTRASVGDPAARERAFSELLRLLAIFVRAGMGAKLRDHRESDDVCQSIARSFLEDLGDGDIEFPNEAAVVAYLRTVVRTKLALLARHDNTTKRGGGVTLVPLAGGQTSDGDGGKGGQHAQGFANDPSSGQPLPDGERAVREAEAIHRLHQQLSPDEQELARLRLGGLDWDTIAARLNQDATALRKKWSRLLDRLTREMKE